MSTARTSTSRFASRALPGPLGRVEDGSNTRSLLALNAIGGALVLYSYYAGMVGGDAVGAALWGGVPEALRPVYTLNMFLAAAGYFLFTPFFVFRLAPEVRSVGSRARYRRIRNFYALVLLPSAAWVPLTAFVIANPSAPAWLAVRVDLALVAVGALGLLGEALCSQSRGLRGRRLALVGLVPFCIQTVVLDALIWPAFFSTPF